MTPFQEAALWPQWVSAVASLLAVAVAIVFGWLTLANNRRSKDAQDRATLAAVSSPSHADAARGILEAQRVGWEVESGGGEQWVLKNTGRATAHDVTIQGFTSLDQQRLTRDTQPVTLGPTMSLRFTLVSRYTLTGPANLTVTFSQEEGGPQRQSVVRVPAP